jgi:hypothetical protein
MFLNSSSSTAVVAALSIAPAFPLQWHRHSGKIRTKRWYPPLPLLPFESVGPYFFCFDGSEDLLCLFRMIPKIGANGYFLFLVHRIEFGIDVKDASSGKLFYPLNPVSSL